jgi:mono/diheme cytochrome c family protein
MARTMTALERVGLAALVLAWAALTWPAPSLAEEAADVARGRELALALCANCHLNAGQGEKAGASGIPGFRAVANRPNATRDDVVRWLKSVPPMMPNHHLTQDEMQALSAFIMSLRVAP